MPEKSLKSLKNQIPGFNILRISRLFWGIINFMKSLEKSNPGIWFFKDFKDFINFKIRVVFPYSEWGGGRLLLQELRYFKFMKSLKSLKN